MTIDMLAPAPVVTDRRPVLLGMNNPQSSDPRHALYPYPPGCAGANLQLMAGLTRSEYLETFDRRNVLPGMAWSFPVARARQGELRESLRGRMVVLLGSEVNSIMRGGTEHELAPLFAWTPDGHGGRMAKIPHPSGRNRQYNDPMVRAALEVFMQETAALAHESPAG